MANSPIDPQFYPGFDGAQLAWRETGEGRPVVLIHGFISDAETNWIKYGHAATIAAAGFRVIMPDLRGHGSSAKPHDAASYPPDALAKDLHALIAHLGLTDYDLGGYSLGGRTTCRLLATGANPRRVVFSGMGLEGLTATDRRAGHFRNILTNLGQHRQGSPEWFAEQFLKTNNGDPIALLGIIATFVSTPVEDIAQFQWPTVVVNGAQDHDNGSAAALADVLPDARYVEVPGNHMSAVLKPDLGQAIADFLSA